MVDSQFQASPTVADQALQRLVEGNYRFRTGLSVHPNQSWTRRAEVERGQHPFAAIFGCVDSRVPPEIIFDCGLGDLFVIRTAGEVVDAAVLGSLEFGALELGIPLIVVLGHQKCGALQASIQALDHHTVEPGQISTLVDSLRPAIDQARNQPGDLVENAVKANITRVVAQLRASPVLCEACQSQCKIVGAYYDLHTGQVEILGG